MSPSSERPALDAEPRPLRALVVDDEPPALRRLVELLGATPRVAVAGTARSVAEATAFLANHEVDVMFLDIDMPRGSGLDLARSFPRGPRVIFVTAHDDYAVDAFDVGAADYLLKPVTAHRLAEAVERIVPPAAGSAAAAAAADERILVPTKAATLVPRRGEIAWIEASRNDSRVVLRRGASVVVRRSIGEWGDTLPGGSFPRLSRSLIVNLQAVEATEWRSRQEVVVRFADCGEPLVVGRVVAERLRRLLAGLPAAEADPP